MAARCCARSRDGRPAGCSGKPKNARPRTPGGESPLRPRRPRAAAERFSPRNERQPRQLARRCRDRGAHDGVRERRRVGPLLAGLHVRELIAQRRDAAREKPGRDSFHERMRHAGAGAMRQHVAGARIRRRLEQGGDADRAIGDDEGCCSRGGHVANVAQPGCELEVVFTALVRPPCRLFRQERNATGQLSLDLCGRVLPRRCMSGRPRGCVRGGRGNAR